jgi:zinc protease
MIGLRTTTKGFRTTWKGFADRVVAPKLDAADVTFERNQTLAALAQRRDSPDGLAQYLADSVAYAGHPYGIDPAGSERSIASLTPELLKAYHHDQFVKSRMLLVVVGDVERGALDSLVSTTLATLPAGTYQWTLPDTIPRHPTSVYREARSLPTNYIVAYAPGPRADDRDYAALRVACAILSGEMFAEVRSRQALTYAVDAPFAERAVSSVGLYVSTTDPAAALAAMHDQLRALQNNRVDERSLAPLIQQFITEYFLGNETNGAQADFLARSQLYLGDWRRGSDFTSTLRAVTPADVQRVVRKYFRDLNFAYVGDPAKMPDSVVRQFE